MNPNTPRFTFKAMDGTDIPIALWCERTPFGINFGFHEFKDGNWIGGPTYGDWFQDGINPIIDEMNAMGVKAWIQKYICPWVAKVLKQVYGGRVQAAPVVVTPPTGPVTVGNVIDTANAVLSEFQLKDTDGDGWPELVVR